MTLERDEQTLVPHGGTLLAGGDRLTLFAAPNQLPAALAVLLGNAAADAVLARMQQRADRS